MTLFGTFDFTARPYGVRSVDGPFLEAERDMLGQDFARRAGGKLLATRYQMKTITVQGRVSGTSIANLRSNWTALELAFSKEAQQLKVHRDTTDRYYIATLRSLEGPYGPENELLVFYTAVFEVPDPFAYAAAPSSDPQANKLLTLVAGNEYKYAWTIAPGGTAPSQPKFTITIPNSTLLTSYAETNWSVGLNIGASSSFHEGSQGFKVAGDGPVACVRLWLKKIAAPADNLTVEIQTDAAGKPSNTPVANGTSGAVAGSSVGTDYGWVIFWFCTPPSLTGATQYHLVLKRSGADDGVNHYEWGSDQTAPGYTDGTTCHANSAHVWGADAADQIFEVYADLPPYDITKLWIINNSLSPALKLAVIKTFAAADVIVIDSSLFEATINAVAAANTEGAYPSLDPRTTNNALELHALATSPPTLSVTTAFTARYLT